MTKNRLRHITILITALLWAGSASAQESVNASGGVAVGSGGSFLPFASGSHPDGSMSDSHIPDYDTKETWEKANKGELGNIEKNQDFIDHLYQSHKAYASIALGIIIHEISHK